MVVDMVIDSAGKIAHYELYQAIVRNHAKLAYNSVAAWLDGKGEEPAAITAVPGLAESIRLQHETSQKMRAIRDRNGALTLETIQTKAVFKDGYIVDLEIDGPNCAKELIEDFMVIPLSAGWCESRIAGRKL
jgi:exoribonuclease R